MPNAINEIKPIKTLNLFPNPTQNMFTLELSLQKNMPLQIDLQNNLGEKVKTVFRGNGENFALPVEVGELGQGIYFLIISGKDFKEVKKVTIIR